MAPPKENKQRRVVLAKSAMEILRRQKTKQTEAEDACRGTVGQRIRLSFHE